MGGRTGKWADGKEGTVFHNQLVQFFWQDVEHRMRIMKVQDTTVQAESTRELLSMFYGLLFAYDEGLGCSGGTNGEQKEQEFAEGREIEEAEEDQTDLVPEEDDDDDDEVVPEIEFIREDDDQEREVEAPGQQAPSFSGSQSHL